MIRVLWVILLLVLTAVTFVAGVNRINPILNFGEQTDPRPWLAASGVLLLLTVVAALRLPKNH